jgi:hypothetical protein
MRSLLWTQPKLVVAGALLLLVFGAAGFAARGPSVDVHLVRMQAANELQDLYPDWYPYRVPCRVAILELRHAGPGILSFDPKEQVLCREQISRCVAPQQHDWHWCRPYTPFPNLCLMYLEGVSRQDYEFLVLVPPDADVLRLSIDYYTHSWIERVHQSVSLRYPTFDRRVFHPVWRLFSHPKKHVITAAIPLQSADTESEHNQSMERMGASHLGHFQLVAQQRLAPTAHARRSASTHRRCISVGRLPPARSRIAFGHETSYRSLHRCALVRTPNHGVELTGADVSVFDWLLVCS